VDNNGTANATTGTIVSGNLDGLSASGDAIFAYQGAATSGNNPDYTSNANPTTFNGTILFGLYAQASSSITTWLTTGTASSQATYLPSQLNVANGNIALGASATRGQYTGSRTNQTSFAAYRTLVNNPANWTTAPSSGTVTLNTTPFTLVTGPTASVITGGSTICAGENTQFSVSVTGGTSPFTVVYSDGTSQFTLSGYVSGTVVTVNPTTTTTYSIVSVTDANSLAGTNNSGSVLVTVNQLYPFYVDGDFDGFGAGNPVSVCAVDANTPPSGYSVTNTDCNDAVAAIYPGASEVPFNGIDDDCDGTIDEGSQITTQVLASQCGTTLTAINSSIGATAVAAPVDGYRFRVVNTTTNEVQTLDRTTPNFQLTALANYEYATTYSISVMLRRNGVWLNYYGSSCLVSTPAVLSPGGAAAVTPSQCGITLPSISTLIATTSLQGVTGYRFRITNVTDNTAPNQVQTLDRVTHWFSLTMLGTYAYGTTYTIEVALKTGNSSTYSGYGAPCSISTPIVPVITNPGVANTTTALFYTTSMNRATSYRFELTLAQSPFTTIIVDRASHYFSFSNVPGYVPGGQYAVRVAVMTSGIWSPFGEAELVTAPGATRGMFEEETAPGIAFRAVAYPNPYIEGFALDMDTPSDAQIQVKVYDMTGKLLEDRNVSVDAIEVQQFGTRLPSGVYNVIVTQGSFVKTLRMIKR
ncbi:MAG: T9SS type A sorting domain-containing protein, partial [Flavobacterium sp.]|uniref:MopE-related protein n=1 Tax=Flavobacterium sp. TaxID=239 RepID=UPI0012264612